MTTSTNPTDDIIELTEIVEEGIPLDKKFEDFAMDKAVDAKSLDQELDDLLRDAAPQSKPAAREAGDEIDLDILFDEPTPAEARTQPAASPATTQTPPATQTPDQSMDISDLDDLFDSLGIGENDTEDTALDIILDGDMPEPRKQGGEAFYPSDSIDLELEIPGMESDDKNSNILDLTEDLLADVPETVLLVPADKPAPEPTTAPEYPETKSTEQAPAQEYPAMEPASELPAEPATATVAEPESQVGDKPGQLVVEQATPQEEMDEPAPIHEAKNHVFAAVPMTATDIEPEQPRVAAEQTMATKPGISHTELEIISARLEALESRPEPSAAPGTEELLALLPQSPQELPVTRNLRQEILEHVESRISELASSSSVDGLQESVSALQSQVEAIPDIRAELAKAPAASLVQKMEAELDELKTLVRNQDETLSLLRQTLTDKDDSIEALVAEQKSLREELALLAAQINDAPAPAAIKSELRDYVQQQVPLAAAKIVREEIQALLKELGG